MIAFAKHFIDLAQPRLDRLLFLRREIGVAKYVSYAAYRAGVAAGVDDRLHQKRDVALSHQSAGGGGNKGVGTASPALWRRVPVPQDCTNASTGFGVARARKRAKASDSLEVAGLPVPVVPVP